MSEHAPNRHDVVVRARYTISISEVTLAVEDVAKAAHFYREVLRLWPDVEPTDRFASFWVGGPGGAPAAAACQPDVSAVAATRRRRLETRGGPRIRLDRRYVHARRARSNPLRAGGAPRPAAGLRRPCPCARDRGLGTAGLRLDERRGLPLLRSRRTPGRAMVAESGFTLKGLADADLAETRLRASVTIGWLPHSCRTAVAPGSAETGRTDRPLAQGGRTLDRGRLGRGDGWHHRCHPSAPQSCVGQSSARSEPFSTLPIPM